MDRRTLLKLLLATAAAETIDFDQLLWVPKPIVTVPAFTKQLYRLDNGQWLELTLERVRATSQMAALTRTALIGSPVEFWGRVTKVQFVNPRPQQAEPFCVAYWNESVIPIPLHRRIRLLCAD